MFKSNRQVEVQKSSLSLFLAACIQQFCNTKCHWNQLLLIAMLYTCITSVMTPNVPDSSCFQCMALTNRQWNEVLTTCQGTKEDCGRCLDGYVETSNPDICERSGIRVKFNDKKVRVPFESRVAIECHFDHPVDCVWNRREVNLEVSGRYSYVNTANGQQTKDCSIIIDKFQDIDVGRWECQSKGDSDQVAIPSTDVQLIPVAEPSMSASPQNASLTNGQKVTVECKFDAEVECQWLLNGSEASKSRYNFKDTDNVQWRRDCSIEIQVPSNHKEHVENWTCSYRSSSRPSSSNTALLTIWKKPSTPEITMQRSEPTCHGNELIVCNSFNGWPAAKLRWEMEGHNLEYSAIAEVGRHLINTTITLNTSKHQQITNGSHTLACIASHPAFAEDLVTEESIQICTEGPSDGGSDTASAQMDSTTESENGQGDHVDKPNFGWIIALVLSVAGCVTAGVVVYLVRRAQQKRHSKETKIDEINNEPAEDVALNELKHKDAMDS